MTKMGCYVLDWLITSITGNSTSQPEINPGAREGERESGRLLRVGTTAAAAAAAVANDERE